MGVWIWYIWGLVGYETILAGLVSTVVVFVDFACNYYYWVKVNMKATG